MALASLVLGREVVTSSTMIATVATAFAAVRAGGKVMQEGGSIVLASTAAVRSGLPNHEAIAAAKKAGRNYITVASEFLGDEAEQEQARA